MPLKQDTRAQLNLKGAKITADFLALLKKAAERQGLSLADFVADAMTAEAQRVLKVEAALPARPEDVTDKLTEMIEQLSADAARRDAEHVARIEGLAARLEREQALAGHELRRTARRRRWR